MSPSYLLWSRAQAENPPPVACVTPLERRCRLLLRAYPAWYRRNRAEEILGTLLEVSSPGRGWPSFHDARALVIGGLRVRGGLVWCMSILWAGVGASGAAYAFFITTKPYTDSDFWIPQWKAEPWVVLIAAWLAVLAWLLLTIPVLVAGLARLLRRRLQAAALAWVCAWVAGLELMHLEVVWSEYPARYLTYTCGGQSGCVVNDYGPAVVSWGELAVFAGWLALGAATTLTLARSARGREMAADTPELPSGLRTGTPRT
jgi:hypothetical protein